MQEPKDKAELEVLLQMNAELPKDPKEALYICAQRQKVLSSLTMMWAERACPGFTEVAGRVVAKERSLREKQPPEA